MVLAIFKKAFIVIILFFLAFGSVQAANFYFSPSAGSYRQGENFTVSVLVNADIPINAVRSVLNFSNEYLEAVALSTANSIVDFWVQNPSFSNAGSVGNVRFEGIVLNPGFAGLNGKVIDVVFRVKKTGSADLTIRESAILANDGLGTNIATRDGLTSFTLIEPAAGAISEKSELEKKIEAVEEKVKAIQESSPFVIVQEPEPSNDILRFWEVLPQWVQVSVLLFVGVGTLILLFIIISLGVIVLIWIWGYFWHNRVRAMWRLAITFANIKYFLKKFFAFLGMIEREVKGDVAYSIHEMKDEIHHAKEAPSLKMLVVSYWLALSRIVKRFFTKNETDIPDDTSQDKI